MESTEPGRFQSYTNQAFNDPAALDAQEMAQVFGWLDSFDAFDPSDLSWLNVVPGDFLA
jgi:hypothetical protein